MFVVARFFFSAFVGRCVSCMVEHRVFLLPADDQACGRGDTGARRGLHGCALNTATSPSLEKMYFAVYIHAKDYKRVVHPPAYIFLERGASGMLFSFFPASCAQSLGFVSVFAFLSLFLVWFFFGVCMGGESG